MWDQLFQFCDAEVVRAAKQVIAEKPFLQNIDDKISGAFKAYNIACTVYDAIFEGATISPDKFFEAAVAASALSESTPGVAPFILATLTIAPDKGIVEREDARVQNALSLTRASAQYLSELSQFALCGLKPLIGDCDMEERKQWETVLNASLQAWVEDWDESTQIKMAAKQEYDSCLALGISGFFTRKKAEVFVEVIDVWNTIVNDNELFYSDAPERLIAIGDGVLSPPLNNEMISALSAAIIDTGGDGKKEGDIAWRERAYRLTMQAVQRARGVAPQGALANLIAQPVAFLAISYGDYEAAWELLKQITAKLWEGLIGPLATIDDDITDNDIQDNDTDDAAQMLMNEVAIASALYTLAQRYDDLVRKMLSERAR